MQFSISAWLALRPTYPEPPHSILAKLYVSSPKILIIGTWIQ